MKVGKILIRNTRRKYLLRIYLFRANCMQERGIRHTYLVYSEKNKFKFPSPLQQVSRKVYALAELRTFQHYETKFPIFFPKFPINS